MEPTGQTASRQAQKDLEAPAERGDKGTEPQLEGGRSPGEEEGGVEKPCPWPMPTIGPPKA